MWPMHHPVHAVRFNIEPEERTGIHRRAKELMLQGAGTARVRLMKKIFASDMLSSLYSLVGFQEPEVSGIENIAAEQ